MIRSTGIIRQWLDDLLLQICVEQRLAARAKREGRSVEEILAEEDEVRRSANDRAAINRQVRERRSRG